MARKQIFSIVLAIFLIGIISATSYNITAGETYSFDIGQVYEYYSITGNTTDVNINISQSGTIVTVVSDKYANSNSFNIVFFDKEKEVIYSSSGSSEDSDGKVSSIPSINKTYPDCDFGAKKCVNNELWYCKDGEWTSIICKYNCKNESCVISEENETLDGGKYLPQKGYVMIVVGFLILVWLIFGIVKLIKLLKKSKGKKADEKQTNF